MNRQESLKERGTSKCELCKNTESLEVFELDLPKGGNFDNGAYLCESCSSQIKGEKVLDPEHWRALADSMWSEHPAIQVLAWRILKELSIETWAQELFEQLYLDEDTLAWAKKGMKIKEYAAVTKDSNGNVLSKGDSVVLIKNLDVKGANFTAKRGTLVRKISLTDNPQHIEGRVDGVHIVILTKFVKKTN